MRRVSEGESFEPPDRQRFRLCLGDAFQRREVEDRVDDLALLVEPALFGEIPDQVPQVARERASVERDLAAVRLDDVEDGPNGRRLAGPVGAQQPEELALAYLKVQIVNS